MTSSLTIAPRFCGPPDSGNGGYVSGLIAGCLDGPAQVTLRLPPPLDRPLAVEHGAEDSVRVLDGNSLVAEAAGLAHDWDLQLPGPVSVRRACAAGARSPLRLQPELHPFPTCFVCGLQRAQRDGLGICVGPVAGTGLSADVWYPSPEFADAGGMIRSEFLWAALDCAGGIAALRDAVTEGAPYVLGRLAVLELGLAQAAQPHVVVGWRLASQHRKVLAGSALFTASGQAVAAGVATWIRLRLPAGRHATSPEAGQAAGGGDSGDGTQKETM